MSILIQNDKDEPLLLSKCVSILLDTGRTYCFDEQTAEIGGVPSLANKKVRRVTRSLSDEMLLTEVGIDDRSLIMYDITGLYTEMSTQIVATRIKCFKNEHESDFFLILDTEDQIKNFNQTFLLTLLKYMKTQKANRLIICLRKD